MRFVWTVQNLMKYVKNACPAGWTCDMILQTSITICLLRRFVIRWPYLWQETKLP